MPIIEWVVAQKLPDQPYFFQFAQGLPPVSGGLASRIEAALTHYPCEILLVHRDSEKQTWSSRMDEIRQVIGQLSVPPPRWVEIVPVRMTEAWLLSSELAVRRAAGNRSSAVDLALGSAKAWEAHPDPKLVLHSALRAASGLTGRRLAKFNVHEAQHRVASLISDFSNLRSLKSFREFESSFGRAFDACAN